VDIYGIIGDPVEHSLSPAMHNAAFKKLGIDAEYRKFEVKSKELEDFLLNKKEVRGFNITIPHKVRAKEILERSFPIVSNEDDIKQHYVDLCGAVNTVKREKDRLLYINTDVLGFLTSLKKDLKFDHADKKVLLIGCGGAGRAIIAGLGYGDLMSKKIYIYDKDNEAIETTKNFFESFLQAAEMLEFISEERMPEVIKDCELLINASPVGMEEGDGFPVDKNLLRKDLFVYDVVYNRETELVKVAKPHAVGGLGMLLYQGAHAFEFWTGRNAPIGVMKEALEKAIK
jgi:shikimate dehydrogenase